MLKDKPSGLDKNHMFFNVTTRNGALGVVVPQTTQTVPAVSKTGCSYSPHSVLSFGALTKTLTCINSSSTTMSFIQSS